MIADLILTAALALPAKHAEPPARCEDKFALMLWDVGFRGRANAVAWAITYRESRHQNLIPGHPQYNGSDVGTWQVNRPSWGGEPWWSESAMSDPHKQSRIVYRILSKRGTNWRPWGLTSPNGDAIDASSYSMWSPSQQYAYIWAGYAEGMSRYPKACAR